jgi:hypothetical protein
MNIVIIAFCPWSSINEILDKMLKIIINSFYFKISDRLTLWFIRESLLDGDKITLLIPVVESLKVDC